MANPKPKKNNKAAARCAVAVVSTAAMAGSLAAAGLVTAPSVALADEVVPAEVAPTPAESTREQDQAHVDEAKDAANKAGEAAEAAKKDTDDAQAEADRAASDAEAGHAKADAAEADARQEYADEKTDADKSAADAQAKVDTAEKDVESAKADVSDKADGFASAEKDAVDAQAKVDTAQSEVDSYDKTGIDDAKAEVESAKSDVEEANSGVESANSDFADAQTKADAAKKAYDTAVADQKSATEAVDTANSAVSDASAKLDAAKKAYEEAQASAQDAYDASVQTAQTKADEAKAALDAATSALESGQQAKDAADARVTSTKSAYDTGKAAADAAESAYKDKQDATAAAKKDLDKAGAGATITTTTATGVNAPYVAENTDVAAAKDNVAAAEYLLNYANALATDNWYGSHASIDKLFWAMANDESLTETQRAYARMAFDLTSKSTVTTGTDTAAGGNAGYYASTGWGDDSLYNPSTGKTENGSTLSYDKTYASLYKQYCGTSAYATDTEKAASALTANMLLKVLSYLQAVNDIRVANGLNELTVDPRLMAEAAIRCMYSSANGGIAHAQLLSSGYGATCEDLATLGNYKDCAGTDFESLAWPFSGWYTQEKAAYDETVSEKGQAWVDTAITAVQTGSASTEQTEFYSSVGHYLNLIDESLTPSACPWAKQTTTAARQALRARRDTSKALPRSTSWARPRRAPSPSPSS